MLTVSQPLFRVSYDAAHLMHRYPPAFRHPNKLAAFTKAMAGPPPSGRVSATRWPAMPLPTLIDAHPTQFEARPGVFSYESLPDGEVHWHLNFANADVFAFYAGPLLAQDELQVLEHPAIASLRHALLDGGHSTFVVETGEPTPLLISGVERRCEMRTAPDPAAGRRFSLYGNAFAAADMPTVRDAVLPIRPPTRSNILAIEAPAYGSGRYSHDDIAFILQTAITGFAAARLESSEVVGAASPSVAIHTGSGAAAPTEATDTL